MGKAGPIDFARAAPRILPIKNIIVMPGAVIHACTSRRPSEGDHPMLFPVLLPTTPTPALSVAGGMLLGVGAALLWLGIGRVAGISGIAGAVIERAERDWRLAFLAGLILAGLIARLIGEAPRIHVPGPAWLLAPAGLLVGIGAAVGGGCTSGHGVCGLARISPRSIAATAIFMAVAFVVVFLTRDLGAL